MSPERLATLDAALARIVPLDDDVRGYVHGRAALEGDLYLAGIMILEGRGFAQMDASDQDATITELEGHPSFALLIQHANEGFYTSTAGFAHVGFRVTA